MAIQLDYFDLLSPEPYYLNSVGNIKSPTLKEIKKIGYNKYNNYIYILEQSKDDLIELLQFEGLENNQDIKYLDIICLSNLGEMFKELLSFFICGDIVYMPNEMMFAINNTSLVNRDNFSDVRDVILQQNYRQYESLEENLSEKERELEAIFREGRKKSLKSPNKDLSIPNLISALYPKHKDIWDMTIYQFYDVFQRENLWNTLDFIKINYAFNGTKINFKEWYKPINN